MKPNPSDPPPGLDLPLVPSEPTAKEQEPSNPLEFESEALPAQSSRRSPRKKAAFDPEDSLPLFAGVEIEKTPDHTQEAARERRKARSSVRGEPSSARPFEPALIGENFRAKNTPPRPVLASEPSRAEPLQKLSDQPALLRRLQSTVGDTLILAGVATTALVGARLLGVSPNRLEGLAPLAVFLLAWSFLYFVVPLAFWGHTPGMAWAGVRARSRGEPISFGQAAWRWVGFWLTLLSGGLFGLLAVTGRSLEDRLSETELELNRELP